MLDRSTEYFDPFVIAERGRSYNGRIPLGQLDRLRDALIDRRGEARFELRFAKEDKHYMVSGRIQADLLLQCSACLEALCFPVRTETRLGIVKSLDEAAQLPEVYEPLLVADRKLRFVDLIEDELLLAIPIIPRHEECGTSLRVDERPMQNKNNPFSILAGLKSAGDH